jgi:hypothetical protein
MSYDYDYDYYEIDNSDKIIITDCYCTENSICRSCEKEMY